MAGLAAMGPVLGSLAAIGDRSVERTLPADLGTTWGATVDALARMALRVEQTDKSGDTWRLTGAGEAVTVHGTLERVTAGMTKVSVRVEAGRLVADRQTGDELLNQVAASLASLAGASRRHETPGPDGSGEQLRGLQREIERLGAKIEQAREASSPTTRPEASPAAAVSPTPVIVIPVSAGVATVPVLDHHPVRPPGPAPVLRQPAPLENKAPARLEATVSDRKPDESILPAPLKSAEVLSPVEGLAARSAGR